MSIYVLHSIDSIINGELIYSFFFFNDTATTEIYTLSLHDALPICFAGESCRPCSSVRQAGHRALRSGCGSDRKSTRLNSSHDQISYAVFCLKKKKPPFRSKRWLSRSGLEPARHLLLRTPNLLVHPC